jgi:hypothetical protein
MGANWAFPHADSPRSGPRVFPRGRDAGLATCRWASESSTSSSRRGDLLREDGSAASTRKNLRARRRDIESDQFPRELECFASSAAIHLATEGGWESLEIQLQPSEGGLRQPLFRVEAPDRPTGTSRSGHGTTSRAGSTSSRSTSIRGLRPPVKQAGARLVMKASQLITSPRSTPRRPLRSPR